MIELNTPISAKDISNLHVGDTVEISGYILCGRDAVLPRVVEMIQEDKADKNYGIIAAYTYNKGNVDDMIQMLPDEYKKEISVYDDLCCSIACHWGPNAFGFIYVKEV